MLNSSPFVVNIEGYNDDNNNSDKDVLVKWVNPQQVEGVALYPNNQSSYQCEIDLPLASQHTYPPNYTRSNSVQLVGFPLGWVDSVELPREEDSSHSDTKPTKAVDKEVDSRRANPLLLDNCLVSSHGVDIDSEAGL